MKFPDRGLSSWHAALYRLYDSLTRNDPVRPVDLIFVLAGRMERKPYGLALYRAGLAPRLLLSVGRFEVGRMRAVDFEKTAELIAERDRAAPSDRHFFCEITGGGTRIERVHLRSWNTYGELLGFREFLARDPPRSVMVISTDVHLRRVAAVIRRVFRDPPPGVCYCPVPAAASSVRRTEWWTRRGDRNLVLSEAVKLAAYRAILTMPEWLIRRLMRLKS